MMFDFLKKPQPVEEVKASKAGPVIAYATSGRVAWSPRDTSSLIRHAFQGNPVGFRSVKLIAEAAASVPLTVRDAACRYELHPVLDLLARPNGGQGRAALFEGLYTQLLLSGDGYLEGVAAEGTLPLELHVLRSDRMSVVPGADGWPVAYEYAVGGRKHRFSVTEAGSPICHVKAYHPGDDHYGLSPMQAAARAVDVHNAASAWSKALLDNAARPSGAIVFKGEGQSTLTNEQYDRLVAEMEAHHQGARNAGRPMLLEGGLDWRPMGFSPSDMEFQKTKEAAAREIALAFGVPPMLLGLPGDATYANYQEANRAFYRLTVLPLVDRVLGAVTNWLNGFADAPVEIAADLDRVPALGVEREALWRRVTSAEFLTEDEKRALLGLPKAQE
ncbi:phage portal protein [Alphaproteobacteria bacterium GH1-50]|uniref:Phage portal protein n=1 Tax=Kangsaoukella pontilimi TaxID=2691042 RepID=A0A7C9IS55_9RHOB|nr:phage portal protein [Kangsaoukella pontilimi]MXQ07645.1 phage portal protein [Kangsaoukella pontilimi]